jgi:16S rRNA C967 or C1407 C5-methylase (RsmB/RsmF family)
MLQLSPGATVLDLCAAPGGKATLAAQVRNELLNLYRYSVFISDGTYVKCEREKSSAVIVREDDFKGLVFCQVLGNSGLVLACDVDKERLLMVEENCLRLGVTCLQTLLASPDAPGGAAKGGFDAVLVDAPCSNTGVMRRRVDLRWRISK